MGFTDPVPIPVPGLGTGGVGQAAGAHGPHSVVRYLPWVRYNTSKLALTLNHAHFAKPSISIGPPPPPLCMC